MTILKRYIAPRKLARLGESCQIAFLLGIATLSVGCTSAVHRRLTVVSEPAGATVYVDQQQIGQTPVSTPFTYYGTREIILEKDGYQTVKELHSIRPPWYERPPFDFFVENFWPRRIHDERVLDFQLAPRPADNDLNLQDRAQQLRDQVHRGMVTPLVTQKPESSSRR